MADIRVHPDVAELVGAETVAELRKAAYGRYDCWGCGLPGRTADATSLVAVLYRNRAVKLHLTHARCADSQLIMVDDDLDVDAVELEDSADIRLKSAVLLFQPGPEVWPVLVLEMRVETFAREPGAERVNLLAALWLERGMTLLGAGDELPGLAAGWLLRLGSGGTAVLTEPGGSTVYEGGHTEPGTWGQLADELRRCVVLIGTIGLYAEHSESMTAEQLTGMLDQAARAGALAGGLVPIRRD
jgi:hypothetical protein